MPADATPGNARTRRKSSSKKVVCCEGFPYLVEESENDMVRTLWESRPGSTFRNRDKLRIINPAPISNTSDNATSETTSTPRVRLPPESASVRPKPCFNESFRFALLARTAGTNPATTPLNIETARVNASTQPSTWEALSQESDNQLHSVVRKNES